MVTEQGVVQEPKHTARLGKRHIFLSPPKPYEHEGLECFPVRCRPTHGVKKEVQYQLDTHIK